MRESARRGVWTRPSLVPQCTRAGGWPTTAPLSDNQQDTDRLQLRRRPVERSRDGGDARRLTTGTGVETYPSFSPDGTMIAFTGEYDGNPDVYVMPATGGVPKRLTYHPGADSVVGWTPDGKSVLFATWANSFRHFEQQLYTVPVTGGFPTKLPLPISDRASFSPDGTRLAYVPHGQWQAAWKRYRGGQTTPIWIAALTDSSVTKIPRDNSNDSYPLWVGDTVYFLSDRNGPVSLFALRHEDEAGLRSAARATASTSRAPPPAPTPSSSSSSAPSSCTTSRAVRRRRCPSTSRPTSDAVRPHFTKVDPKRFQNFGISPTGARAVFEAWGEIFTVPTERATSATSHAVPPSRIAIPRGRPTANRSPTSPIESGEYELHIRDQNGLGEVRQIQLGTPPSFFYTPDVVARQQEDRVLGQALEAVVPRSRLAQADPDRHRTTSGASGPVRSIRSGRRTASGSPTRRQLPNGLHAVFLYSLESKKSSQITDGMSDALFPRFDKNGKYLYFTASTDNGLTTAGLDMSSDAHPVPAACTSRC